MKGGLSMSIEVNPHTAEPATEVFPDREALAGTVAGRLLQVLRQTVEADGIAHAALTGGGAGIAVLETAAQLLRSGQAEAPDWSGVHLWWGDERLLPVGDPERNATQAFDALVDQLITEQGLPERNVHPMPTSEDAADPQAGAEMYAEELHLCAEGDERDGLAVPKFAVILLGVGPDGHIASLFPGKASLQVADRSTVGEEDSPKPPPPRVSLTFAAIHTAERVWTVVAGEDKAEAAAKALDPATPVERIPAKNARGLRETVWHLDEAAASQLRG